MHNKDAVNRIYLSPQLNINSVLLQSVFNRMPVASSPRIKVNIPEQTIQKKFIISASLRKRSVLLDTAWKAIPAIYRFIFGPAFKIIQSQKHKLKERITQVVFNHLSLRKPLPVSAVVKDDLYARLAGAANNLIGTYAPVFTDSQEKAKRIEKQLVGGLAFLKQIQMVDQLIDKICSIKNKSEYINDFLELFSREEIPAYTRKAIFEHILKKKLFVDDLDEKLFLDYVQAIEIGDRNKAYRLHVKIVEMLAMNLSLKHEALLIEAMIEAYNQKDLDSAEQRLSDLLEMYADMNRTSEYRNILFKKLKGKVLIEEKDRDLFDELVDISESNFPVSIIKKNIFAMFYHALATYLKEVNPFIYKILKAVKLYFTEEEKPKTPKPVVVDPVLTQDVSKGVDSCPVFADEIIETIDRALSSDDIIINFLRKVCLEADSSIDSSERELSIVKQFLNDTMFNNPHIDKENIIIGYEMETRDDMFLLMRDIMLRYRANSEQGLPFDFELLAARVLKEDAQLYSFKLMEPIRNFHGLAISRVEICGPKDKKERGSKGRLAYIEVPYKSSGEREFNRLYKAARDNQYDYGKFAVGETVCENGIKMFEIIIKGDGKSSDFGIRFSIKDETFGLYPKNDHNFDPMELVLQAI
ncbi:MAG: hypothetical protein GY853_03715 [PVC group bacterium]|nr:hypothetical protein [PVC group bacterium]